MTLIITLIFAVILVTALFLYYHSLYSKKIARLTDSNNSLTICLERYKSETLAKDEKLHELQSRYEELESKNSEHIAELLSARESLSSLSTKLELINVEKDRQENIRRQEEKATEERFKNLANEILRQNTSDLKNQNEEKLREILGPLRENLEEFKKTVWDTYNNESRERFSLSERIKELVSLNQALSRQAKDLTDALKGDSKMQGDWGEMVLESILEKSGLQMGEEYFTQVTTDASGNVLRNEDGSMLRPDVVVRYPDGRFVVIDSKVSLTAFVDYVNADSEADRDSAVLRHVRSVRKHIDELSKKSYQEYVGDKAKLDFVMMFIPNEPAYIAAMRHESNLWQEAYDRHVLIVSPTHLVSGLRLIAQLWSRDRQTKNAILIAEEAGKMYDKFADFTKDMEKIEKAITASHKAYGDAMNKLSTGSGNLIGRACKLQELGVKAKKQLAASSTTGE